MILWLAENIGTIIIGIIVAVVAMLITAHLIRNKKRGESSCGCGCSSCAMSGSCHSKK